MGPYVYIASLTLAKAALFFGVLYVVVRFAVKHGVTAALKERDKKGGSTTDGPEPGGPAQA